MNFHQVILPELILVVAASVLFLLGVSSRVAARKLSAQLAMLALVGIIIIQSGIIGSGAKPMLGGFVSTVSTVSDETIVAGPFSNYVKLLTAIVGALLLMLAWPSNRNATGNRSLELGRDAGEFYALMLLSLCGLMLVASANDMILLFLGLELASIPTYIMVSLSRPLPAAQEAGVKYFFLGAMAAAIMLFGFSYLYGTTGFTKLSDIRAVMNPAEIVGSASAERVHPFTHWEVLAMCMLMAGFSFKIAAVPLHAYVGDVYQGAATPVTAFLAFVPKASGFVAIIKMLAAAGGSDWRVSEHIVNLMWVLAVLTMTFGNMLGLLQANVKRVLAYSSIAHSGYMLVGITALIAAGDAGLAPMVRDNVQRQALAGVLFYLTAYGIMNVGAFGVLMLLPSREQRYDRGAGDSPRATSEGIPATTAETFEDIAGIGRRKMGLALAMTVCCFSLIGLPFTVGFFGKLYLIQPALGVGTSKMNWLVVLTVANAAIGAAYYLRIVATMFLRPEPAASARTGASDELRGRAWYATPAGVSVVVCSVLTLLLGAIIPATNVLSDRSMEAAHVDVPAASGSMTAEARPPQQQRPQPLLSSAARP